MKPSANMDKKIIDSTAPFGRNLYISRAGGLALVVVSLIDKAAYIHDLVVDNSLRGLGMGNLLLADAIEEAENGGAEVARLTVQPQTWMEEWYERNGFQFTGFTSLNGCFCAAMEKELKKRAETALEPQKS